MLAEPVLLASWTRHAVSEITVHDLADGRRRGELPLPGLGSVTGRLAVGYDADLIVVHGDPLTDITAVGRLRRVIARGRDYVPDSGRFDVSAPGTPFADPDHPVDMRLITEATRRRRA